MALLTPFLAFLFHLPQVYKWLLKPYYVASLFMSIAFLLVRKTPGICDHLSTQREDGNPCDFDWVSTSEPQSRAGTRGPVYAGAAAATGLQHRGHWIQGGGGRGCLRRIGGEVCVGGRGFEKDSDVRLRLGGV